MMSLSAAAVFADGRTSGGDPVFTGVSTDTRTLQPGDLFVALRGERYDGHTYLEQAKAAGAVAAMVDSRHQETPPVPVAVVDDTRLGLGRLAAGWRQLLDLPPQAFQRLRISARARIASQFSLAASVAQYEALYEETACR